MSGLGARGLDVSDWSETGLLANLAAHLSFRLNRTLTPDEVFDAIAQRITQDIRLGTNVHVADQFEARLLADRRADPDRPLTVLMKYGAKNPPLWWYCLGADLAATLCGIPPAEAGPVE